MVHPAPVQVCLHAASMKGPSRRRGNRLHRTIFVQRGQRLNEGPLQKEGQ